MTLPPTIALVPVVGEFTDALGVPHTGTVTFTPSSALNAPEARLNISARAVVCTLINGRVTVRLPANNDPGITPADTHYNVVVDLDGEQARRFPMRLPYGQREAYDLVNVVQVAEANGLPRWAQIPDLPWSPLEAELAGGRVALRWNATRGDRYVVTCDGIPAGTVTGGLWVDPEPLDQASVYQVHRVGRAEQPLTVAMAPEESA